MELEQAPLSVQPPASSHTASAPLQAPLAELPADERSQHVSRHLLADVACVFGKAPRIGSAVALVHLSATVACRPVEHTIPLVSVASAPRVFGQSDAHVHRGGRLAFLD